MKIIQLTDLHVANEGEHTYGVDVRQNFLDMLKQAKNRVPDLLVLSGDLCLDKGDAQVYRWMKSQMDELSLPYAVIAGNHDDSRMLAEVFQLTHLLTDGELYFKSTFGAHTILFLETSLNVVSEKHLTWIAAELAQLDRPGVIFMHHPPVVGGVPYMDINYPLRNIPAVQQALQNSPQPLTVFCGHYHVEKCLCLKNLTVHITPSTFFQMTWDSDTFSVDHYRPALREIVLRDDGVVESTILYFEANRL